MVRQRGRSGNDAVHSYRNEASSLQTKCVKTPADELWICKVLEDEGSVGS